MWSSEPSLSLNDSLRKKDNSLMTCEKPPLAIVWHCSFAMQSSPKNKQAFIKGAERRKSPVLFFPPYFDTDLLVMPNPPYFGHNQHITNINSVPPISNISRSVRACRLKMWTVLWVTLNKEGNNYVFLLDFQKGKLGHLFIWRTSEFQITNWC